MTWSLVCCNMRQLMYAVVLHCAGCLRHAAGERDGVHSVDSSPQAGGAHSHPPIRTTHCVTSLAQCRLRGAPPARYTPPPPFLFCRTDDTVCIHSSAYVELHTLIHRYSSVHTHSHAYLTTNDQIRRCCWIQAYGSSYGRPLLVRNTHCCF
jgi:hypothetical protein